MSKNRQRPERDVKGKAAKFKTREQVREAIESSPLKFKRSWEVMRKDTREPSE